MIFSSEVSKEICDHEFDVDLVMGKPCPNSCTKLLGKRKFLQPKSKHPSPYKMHKSLSTVPTLSSFDDQAPRES